MTARPAKGDGSAGKRRPGEEDEDVTGRPGHPGRRRTDAAHRTTDRADRTVTPSTSNPLGTKGVGEAGTIASTPCVVNAVVDALKPFGVIDVQMPCTPERIWKAIHGRGAGGADPTEGEAMPHFDEKDVADRSEGGAQ